MEKVIYGAFVFVHLIVVVSAVGLLLAFPIKLCWNYVMPYLFDLKQISWGQAWCINFLCSSLIRSTTKTN